MILNGRSSIPGFLPAVILFVFFLGCSVKEDRDACPCNLQFDLTDAFNGSDGTLTLVVRSDGGFVFCDTLKASASGGAGKYVGDRLLYAVQVPRENITIDFYSPFGALVNPLLGYRPVTKCDPVWKWSDSIVARGERIDRTVKLHKEYCRLTVTLMGDGDVVLPYSLLFVSGVNGYHPGGTLSEGLFVERVSPANALPLPSLARWDSAGKPAVSCSLNLLRQKDASLMMEVVPEDADGVSLRSFALGEYLQAAGYDWTDTDLEDVEIVLDFAGTSIEISTDKWTRRVEFNVVI